MTQNDSTSAIDPQTAFFRARYRQFVLDRLGGRRSPTKVVIGLAMACSVVLIPIALHLIISGLRRTNGAHPRLQKELDFIDRAFACFAAPIMVNAKLRVPSDEVYPGLFMVSFEPGLPQTIAFVAEVADAIETPFNTGLSKADKNALLALTTDEEFRPGRRRQLPLTITHGHTVYAVDLALHARYLMERHISEDMPFVACLAERREEGEIRAIPYWTARDAVEPAWARATKPYIG